MVATWASIVIQMLRRGGGGGGTTGLWPWLATGWNRMVLLCEMGPLLCEIFCRTQTSLALNVYFIPFGFHPSTYTVLPSPPNNCSVSDARFKDKDCSNITLPSNLQWLSRNLNSGILGWTPKDLTPPHTGTVLLTELISGLVSLCLIANALPLNDRFALCLRSKISRGIIKVAMHLFLI